MVRLDVVKTQMVEASMADSRKKLKNLCGTVAELISQMSTENSLHKIRLELDKQYESMEQDLYLFRQFHECLLQILPLYIGCEEGNAEYAEEVQLNNTAGFIGLVDIPEDIFRLLK